MSNSPGPGRWFVRYRQGHLEEDDLQGWLAADDFGVVILDDADWTDEPTLDTWWDWYISLEVLEPSTLVFISHMDRILDLWLMFGSSAQCQEYCDAIPAPVLAALRENPREPSTHPEPKPRLKAESDRVVSSETANLPGSQGAAVDDPAGHTPASASLSHNYNAAPASEPTHSIHVANRPTFVIGVGLALLGLWFFFGNQSTVLIGEALYRCPTPSEIFLATGWVDVYSIDGHPSRMAYTLCKQQQTPWAIGSLIAFLGGSAMGLLALVLPVAERKD